MAGAGRRTIGMGWWTTSDGKLVEGGGQETKVEEGVEFEIHSFEVKKIFQKNTWNLKITPY